MARASAGWRIEDGIGEVRAVLIEDGRIVEARIELEGSVPAGTVLAARLVSNGAQGRNAVAVDAGGCEYLLPRAPGAVAEGGSLVLEVTRAAFPGTEPWKRPLARVTEAAPCARAPLAAQLGAQLLSLPAPDDELEPAGWSDILEEARSGAVMFAGGSLRVSPTPAMTLIDVDGTLPPEELAVRGATEAARTIRRLAIGGSIGIDLPTVRGKAARQAAADAIDAVLPPRFERTGVNGFGFIHIVRSRTGPSLLELASDAPGFEARALLRRAARSQGAQRLVANPAVVARIEAQPAWLEQLARQIGGPVTLRADPRLAMWSAYVEPVQAMPRL